MLSKGYTEQTLRAFRKYDIQQARTNLTKNKKNFSKELYDSLDGDFKVNPNSIELNFKMEEYGLFQDKGVKGVKSNYPENRGTPFSYKTSSNLIGLEGATGQFGNWAKHKRLRFRDVKGRYLSYKSIGFILANSIKNKGIKASMFFTKPFQKAYENLDEDLAKAYGLDVVEFLEFSLKNIDLKTKK